MTEPRRGFTLVEVALGLALAGLVLLVARATLDQVASGARRLATVRGDHDHRLNARRWLTSAFLSLQVGQDRLDTFHGAPAGVAYTARILTPAGWPEPTRVELSLLGSTFVAVLNGADTVRLDHGVASVETQYLLTGGERSEWLRGWYSPSTAPVAVRVIYWWRHPSDAPARSDTVLYLIGSRG